MFLRVALDFVCPYCYVMEAYLQKLRKEGLDLCIQYIPFELTEPPHPRADIWADPQERALYERDLLPLCRSMNLPARLPPRISPRPYSRKAFQAMFMARLKRLEMEWAHRVFQAYFEEERDIGKTETLLDLAEDVGLDPVELNDALLFGEYDEPERGSFHHAKLVLEVQRLPTLFLGDCRMEPEPRDFLGLPQWLEQGASALQTPSPQ